MPRIKGPYDIEWGNNVLVDINELDVDWDQDTEEYSTLQHNRFEVDGSIMVKVTATFLRSDVESLAAVLPQYYVANAGTLSTGQTVDSSVGAIDVVPNCEGEIRNDLDITSCGNPGQTMRLVNARTRISGVDNPDKLRTVMVEFVGEAEGGKGVVQWFTQGAVS